MKKEMLVEADDNLGVVKPGEPVVWGGPVEARTVVQPRYIVMTYGATVRGWTGLNGIVFHHYDDAVAVWDTLKAHVLEGVEATSALVCVNQAHRIGGTWWAGGIVLAVAVRGGGPRLDGLVEWPQGMKSLVVSVRSLFGGLRPLEE